MDQNLQYSMQNGSISCTRRRPCIFLIFVLILCTFGFISNHHKAFSFSTFNVVRTIFADYPSFIIINETANYPLELALANNDSRVIVAWTKFFGVDFLKQFSCAEDVRCRFTSNRSEISNAAAVLFHIRDLSRWDLPKDRHKWQRYVFFLMEAPPNTFFHLQSLQNGFFNYTMTYRLDSDILGAYGSLGSGRMLILEPNNSLPQSVIEAAYNKTKLVLWMASNCNTASNREDVVKEMRRYLDVDIWGKCGNRASCPKDQSELCEERLDREYKFYLAFENSICKDYVTEKFWNRVELNSVPIVLRRRILRDVGIPDSGFLAVDDFPSVKDLTDHILYLDANVTAYLEYFKWKVLDLQVNETKYSGMCGLCEKLHDPTAPIKFYSNIARWWYTESECVT